MTENFINRNIAEAIMILKSLIATAKFPNNQELLEICKENRIYLTEAARERQRIHDLLETAVNLYLYEKYIFSKEVNKYKILTEIEDFERKLPTQTWRDGEQTIFQQFSTPPALGYVIRQFINPAKDSITLEPSAGTGSLANWLKIAGCQTKVNEISARRRLLLEIQDYKPHAVNAEFLDDLLETDIKPDFILMNPPFSSSTGRTLKGDSNFGFRHIESALSRLNTGGRLVCLLGAKSCLQTHKGKLFWKRIGEEYKVHCFLIVPAKAFYKYGTTFQTVVAIVDKFSATQSEGNRTITKPRQIEFNSLKEMLEFSETFNQTNY